MIEMRKHIRKSLAMMLSLDILIIVVLVFTLSLGFLYWRSRHIVRQESIEQASHVLDNTALRVKGYMVEIETATRNILWLVNLHTYDKDSLLKYTHPSTLATTTASLPILFALRNIQHLRKTR